MKENDYIIIPNWLLGIADVKSTSELIVLAKLVSLTDDGSKSAKCSMQYLSSWCICSDRGIRKVINRLKASGLITSANKGASANLFAITEKTMQCKAEQSAEYKRNKVPNKAEQSAEYKRNKVPTYNRDIEKKEISHTHNVHVRRTELSADEAKNWLKDEITDYLTKHPNISRDDVNDFYESWTEADDNGTLKFQSEKFWSTANRLRVWSDSKYKQRSK